jgi:hypothetical protein
MAHSIRIDFEIPPAPGLERNLAIHDLRNFAEELSLTLGELGSLPMEQADAAVDHIVIGGIKTKNVRRCRAHVEGVNEKTYRLRVTITEQTPSKS